VKVALDLILVALPIALLILWMARKRAMPSNRALPLAALVPYALLLVYFAGSPRLVHAAVSNVLGRVRLCSLFSGRQDARTHSESAARTASGDKGAKPDPTLESCAAIMVRGVRCSRRRRRSGGGRRLRGRRRR
jgi:hypothetical protein